MMGSSSRNIIDVFIKLIQSLECPVCYEYVATPIWQCEAGHIICNQCKGSIYNCPTCRCTFSSVRVRSLEQISDLMLFPCKNDGCEKILPLTDIKYHENSCSLANASSRPDEFGRSAILQYNLLKYIEHDIAPFFITGRQSHERGTQTESECWRTNVKDASTMANSNSRTESESVGSPKQVEIRSDVINVTPSKLNFESFSLGGPNSSTSDVHNPLNSILDKGTLNTAVNNTSAVTQSKNLNIVASHNRILAAKNEQRPKIKAINHSSTASEKLSDLFRDNERKCTKGSTKYDCFLQSTSSKSGGTSTSTSTKSGFDFSPFINKTPSCSTSHPLPNDVSNFTSEPIFKFSFEAPTPSAGTSTSEPVQGIPLVQPALDNNSVFCFQTRNETSETNKPMPLSRCLVKENRFDGNKHRHCFNLNKKGSFHKKSSGFDFSAFLSEGNRTEVTGNIMMSSMNTTTTTSSNASNTNVIQSVNTPVFSPIVFSDVTYSETFKGTLDSFSQKAASAFNNKKQSDDTPHSADISIDLRTNRPSEDIRYRPSTSEISSVVASSDLGSGMPFSISRNTDPLDSLPTNSTTLSLDSCSSSVVSGESNSSALCQVNAESTTRGSENNESDNLSSSSTYVSGGIGFQTNTSNLMPLKSGLKTRLSGDPIFSFCNIYSSSAGTSDNTHRTDSKSLRMSFPPRSLNDSGPCETSGRNCSDISSNDSSSARNPPSLQSVHTSSQSNNHFPSIFNQATETAAVPIPSTSSSVNLFVFPSKISDKISKKIKGNSKPSFYRNFYNFGQNSDVLKQLGNANSTQYKSAQNNVPNSTNLENVCRLDQQIPRSLSFTSRGAGNTGDSLSFSLSNSSPVTDKLQNGPFPINFVPSNRFGSEGFNFCSQSNSSQNLTSHTSGDSDQHGNSESAGLITTSGNIFPGPSMQSWPGTSGSSGPLYGTNSILETVTSNQSRSESTISANVVDVRAPPSGMSSTLQNFNFVTPSAQEPRNTAFSLYPCNKNEPFHCFFQLPDPGPSGADIFCSLKESERKTSLDSPISSDPAVNRFIAPKPDSSSQSGPFTYPPFTFGHASKSTESSASSGSPVFTFADSSPSSSHNPLFTFGRENNTLWNSKCFDSASQGNSKSSRFSSNFLRENGPKKQ